MGVVLKKAAPLPEPQEQPSAATEAKVVPTAAVAPKKAAEDVQLPLDLIAKTDIIHDKIMKMIQQRDELFLRIALATCPYEVGQVLKTDSGLGKVGLKIHEIVAPSVPETGNWWRVNTFALSKVGAVTNRAVALEQCDAGSAKVVA